MLRQLDVRVCLCFFTGLRPLVICFFVLVLIRGEGTQSTFRSELPPRPSHSSFCLSFWHLDVTMRPDFEPFGELVVDFRLQAVFHLPSAHHGAKQTSLDVCVVLVSARKHENLLSHIDTQPLMKMAPYN